MSFNRTIDLRYNSEPETRVLRDHKWMTTSGSVPMLWHSMFGFDPRIKSSERILELITNGVDMTQVDDNGFNCLHYAIVSNSEETVHLLLNLGIDPNERTGSGLRAIDIAAQTGSEYLMKLLAPMTEGITETDLEIMVLKDKKKPIREILIDILSLLARIIVLLTVFSAIFWAYPQYVITYLPKSMSYVVLHVCLIATNACIWISWYKTCTSDPGYIPMNTKKYNKVMESKLWLGKETQTTHRRPDDPHKDLRLCHTCRCVQTMRSTHCRLCNRCVAGFDHHCIYLSTCIGINNRLSFFSLALSMLLVGPLGALLVWVVAEDNTFLTPYHWFNLLYCLQFSLIGLTITLCNIRRAAINLTQNEEIKCCRYRHLIGTDGQFVNPYDRGSYWKNICDYFTKNSYKYSKLHNYFHV